jgi:hypothetical protein
MKHRSQPCLSCGASQRLSTLTFAIFAALLAGGALDPAVAGPRQAALGLCALLATVAVFRHPLGRIVARMLQHRRRTAAR